MSTTLVFEIYEGDRLVATERRTRDVIKIGRLPSSHLHLDDADVSRMHAVIECTAEGVFVIDLGSATGTQVDGQRVNKAELHDGAELTLGGLRLVVRFEAAAAKVVPPPVATLPNPFAAPVPPPPGVAAAPTDDVMLDEPKVQWGVVASGPPVAADEVETQEDAYEVVVLWGENVLHVAHVDPAASFVLGEEGDVDFLVGAELLGADRLAIVDAGQVRIPAGAHVDGEDAPRTALSVASGDTDFEIGQLRVRVSSVRKGKKIAGGTAVDRRPYAYVGGVLGLAGAMLALLSLLPPKSSALSLSHIDQNSRLVAYLMEPPVTEFDEVEPEQANVDEAAGGEGERHEGETGAMGDREAPQADRRYAVEGPEDNPDPHLAREQAEEMAQNAGVLGTLRTMVGSWNVPTSPFGRDSALGTDAMNALGHLTGADVGDAFGFGGLGPVGTGRGAGGTGQGTVGLDSLGQTLGHGGGCRGGERCREGQGYGAVGGSGLRDHRSRVPRITRGTVEARGSLSREVIQRVVRRHHNEVRFCYQQALSSRPDLGGRVTTRFIISSTGAVQTALVASSTLGHSQTEQCIASAVQRWAFPAPDGGGIVSVTYPFVLQQTN